MEVITVGQHLDRLAQPGDMYELMHQGKLWRDVKGVWHEIADMTPEHRLNVSKLLLRRAALVKMRSELAAWARGCGYNEAFDHGIDMTDGMENATLWLTDTPLYRALVAGFPEGARAMADLRRRASHHHGCQHSKRPEQRTHGAPCTCLRAQPKVVPDVAA